MTEAIETQEEVIHNFKVGDKAWMFIHGIEGFSYVLVTIQDLHIDLTPEGGNISKPVSGQSCAELQQKYPDHIIGAWVDEPVGHDCVVRELVPTFSEMREEARDIAEDFVQDGFTDFKAVDLNEWRKRQVEHIRSTGNLECKLENYTPKDRGIHWFGPEVAT
jgi:hypothetical protein